MWDATVALHYQVTKMVGTLCARSPGIAIYQGATYTEINDRIVCYSSPSGSIMPNGSAGTIVCRLRVSGDHPML